MVAIKCRNYDDNGQGQCLRAGCTFVHPSDPQWAFAQRRPVGAGGRGRGRGRGRGGGFEEPSTRDGGWGAQGRRSSGNSNSNANSEWDEAAWKPPPSPSISSGGKGKGRDNGGGWGSGWGGTGVSGWGATTSTTAGDEKTRRENTRNPDPPKTTTDNSGGWGTGSWGTTSAWGTTTESGDNSSTSIAPVVSDPPPPTRPTNLQVDVGDGMQVDPPPPPQSASSAYRAASQAPSDRVPATPQSAFPPFSAGPRTTSLQIENMTRSQIHGGIIKNSVRVTRIRLELEDLRRQFAKWRTTQLSPQFHRVSPEAGSHLNTIANELSGNIARVEKRLETAEEELVLYPELPSTAPDIRDVDREMMAYTEELEAWLVSFATLAANQAKPAPSAADSAAMDLDLDPPDGFASLLVDLDARIVALEEKLGDMEELTNDPDFVSPERHAAHIERIIATARTKLRSKEPDNTRGDAPAADPKANFDAKVAFLAEQVVLLQEKNKREKQRLAAVEYRREQHRAQKIAVRLSSQCLPHMFIVKCFTDGSPTLQARDLPTRTTQKARHHDRTTRALRLSAAASAPRARRCGPRARARNGREHDSRGGRPRARGPRRAVQRRDRAATQEPPGGRAAYAG
ncbi:hypothetical protein DFH07DRAFT_495040 [Mycena maculata]|uniref:C3H1-type domain-containing protein n=1 Tax=Mycena maculata TaxID=230809 RepID=A0AAD7J167_9AGAR|nr:hypothetical protein DFH07DRAFT_495040 [Mycena maculata]